MDTALNHSPPPSEPARLQKYLRRGLVGASAILIILKIVVLSPSSLEESELIARVVSLEELILKPGKTLAPGIPEGAIPDYKIQDLDYYSTRGGEKQWNLLAEQAYFFNAQKLVHAKQVKAKVFDASGKVTLISGTEAKYLMDRNDLEIFGNVETTFPDGFVLHSQYIRYQPKLKKIDIPIQYLTSGDGRTERTGEKIHFTSLGLEFETEKSEITLPKDVHFHLVSNQGEEYEIFSDHCKIHRAEHLVDFTMDPSLPDEKRFVRLHQVSLEAHGRAARLKYGGQSSRIEMLSLFDDVLIQEFALNSKKEPSLIRYGTGGHGDFDSAKNLIILTIYPQVYQGDDTLTGDKITLHRDSDTVEVEQSNAFSAGEKNIDSHP